MDLTYDYVVAGGGSAGCAVAAGLARDRMTTVGLLEAGPDDAGIPQVLELPRWRELVGSELDEVIGSGDRPTGPILHRCGHVLGGSSSINGCVAWRAPEHDLRGWVAAGASGWGPEETGPHFDRVLSKVGLETTAPGSQLAGAFLGASEASGFARRAWNAEATGEGVGYWTLNKVGSLRRSSSVVYLRSRARPNLTVLTRTKALRVRLDEHGCAAAIETEGGGTIRARREVVLSCGALGTPKLLLLSGIGPVDQLRALGIQPVVDLPVGRGLTDHPLIGTTFRATRPIQNPAPLATDVVLRTRLPGSRGDHLDLMIFPYEGHHEEFNWGLRNVAGPVEFSLVMLILNPMSRGTVSLRSIDAADPVRIEPGYLTDPAGHDARVAVRGLGLVRRLTERAGMRDLVEREITPGDDAHNDGSLEDYIRSVVDTGNHLVGTCRMGRPGDPGTVVDPQLRVHGVGRLRIADASVFPTQICVNPNITCLMIGERCADLVLAAT